MDTRIHELAEEELYYFDLRGYLIVRGVLSAEEVSECNAALNEKTAQD